MLPSATDRRSPWTSSASDTSPGVVEPWLTRISPIGRGSPDVLCGHGEAHVVPGRRPVLDDDLPDRRSRRRWPFLLGGHASASLLQPGEGRDQLTVVRRTLLAGRLDRREQLTDGVDHREQRPGDLGGEPELSIA